MTESSGHGEDRLLFEAYDGLPPGDDSGSIQDSKRRHQFSAFCDLPTRICFCLAKSRACFHACKAVPRGRPR